VSSIALDKIAGLYLIERDIRAAHPTSGYGFRTERRAALFAELKAWLAAFAKGDFVASNTSKNFRRACAMHAASTVLYGGSDWGSSGFWAVVPACSISPSFILQ
jgi:hypothetical protein